MNRFRDDIQTSIAQLGDHLGRIQLLVRNLTESRNLTDGQIDPETELAIVCWLEEADEVVSGLPRRYRHREPFNP